jgi:hypothetical protein
VLVPIAAVAPVLIVDLPVLIGVGLTFLKALQLLLLGNMEGSSSWGGLAYSN